MTRVPSSFVAAALPVGFALMLLTVVEQAVRRLSGRAGPDARPRDVM
jgi:TRAP-type C4-dicarboxylate transport system permease small subunit